MAPCLDNLRYKPTQLAWDSNGATIESLPSPPHNRMTRIWKPLLGLVVVLAAFTVSFGWPVENGLQIDIDTSPRAQAARAKTPWDLKKLQVMNRVIHQVNEDYVDPKRVDHQKMMLAGLDAIQRDVAPVLVYYDLRYWMSQFKVRFETGPESLHHPYR